MTDHGLQSTLLEDPRLAAHALSPMPVWLWSKAADRILWANPVAAAIFDATSPAALMARRFDPRHGIVPTQIARLADALPESNGSRLERLRGFGARIGGALICLCSPVDLGETGPAILVVATERAGKELALPERARRLLHDLEQPSAIFTADGELIDAQPAARERLAGRRDLIALGAESIARTASNEGSATGDIVGGPIKLIKLGAGPTFGLLAFFGDGPAQAPLDEIATAGSAAVAQTEPGARRLPLRFVWETNADTHFTLASEDFVELSGPKTAALLGKPWAEMAKELNIDANGRIANALAARETFSDINIEWPVDGSDGPLAVELSGLPIFDREREFKGFRGFGIYRGKDQNGGERQQHAVAPANDEPPKIVAFPSSPTPALNAREHSAFRELARELSQRLRRPSVKGETALPDESIAEPPPAPTPQISRPPKPARDVQDSRPILDRLPTGVLVYRLNTLIYANRAFLEWTGYATLDELAEAGGLESLFIENSSEPRPDDPKNPGKALTIATMNGNQKPVSGRLFSMTWNGENALALTVDTHPAGAMPEPEAAAAEVARENRELKAILDTATDGVLVLDRSGRVLSSNRSAQALFGYEASELSGLSMVDLLVPESHRAILAHLDRLAQGDGVGALSPGYETIGRVRQGGLVPLHITIGRIEDGEKLCAVLRDITAWKRTEEELLDAQRTAEQASIAKSEFLAKVSHEIRTPLNAIIGFSEVMMDERFGPIGSERYRQYLKDIHASGGHLISLVNDLLDLSKIESGKLELTFVSVNLNDLVQQCVAIMQQQANRERVIIRTSLPANLPQVIADTRSIRQIALNLLSNSIKFTAAGGQVIISTTQTDDNQVVLRVRDTGSGMSQKELLTALEPFRQVATAARWGSSGTGLGLPITKALAEANHAEFRISSRVDDGTMVEVIFPPGRVLAQ
jgi:PAS domain S-box-containing protein